MWACTCDTLDRRSYVYKCANSTDEVSFPPRTKGKLKLSPLFFSYLRLIRSFQIFAFAAAAGVFFNAALRAACENYSSLQTISAVSSANYPPRPNEKLWPPLYLLQTSTCASFPSAQSRVLVVVQQFLQVKD